MQVAHARRAPAQGEPRILGTLARLTLWAPVLLAPRVAAAVRPCAGDGVLWPVEARVVEAWADAVLRGPRPGPDWGPVVRNVDAWLSLSRSGRTWRIRALLLLVEVAPVLVGMAPLTWLTTAGRRCFADRHLARPRGLFAFVLAGEQLLKMAYYAARTGTRREALHRTHDPLGPASEPVPVLGEAVA